MRVQRIIFGWLLGIVLAMIGISGCTRSSKGLAAIGEIDGILSWEKSSGVPNPATVSNALGITPVTVKVLPGSDPNSLGSTVVTWIKEENVDVVFGIPADSGSRVTVTYTVSKLPLDTDIQLEVRSKQPIPGTDIGTFARDQGPQSAICSFSNPTVSQFNFHAVPPPH